MSEGQYRLVFRHEDATMEFFGTYLEVTPHSRLVWTNEEGDNGNTVTTVTFDEKAGKTLVVHDRYPSKEALDSGSAGAMPEALDQLDEPLASVESSGETRWRSHSIEQTLPAFSRAEDSFPFDDARYA